MRKIGWLRLIAGAGLLVSMGAHAADVEVRMLNRASDGQRGFEPALVHIDVGDSVHFVAADSGHGVESIPGMAPAGAGAFSGKISEDLTVKFDKPGVYGYRCIPHYMLGMVGLIVVGHPTNEAAARSVAQPREAKARFDQLFATLDHEQPTQK
ncbi:pseudoazurin [Burkholderia vietnamiensis]|jgi:pseudoazurin|uniref:Pseudoazurin n=3 Tax=Burkholderia vietnamiensis TaxID=60552 RepID=A4JPF9_BURVG|nr:MULTISPECIES: pseudoazurin [Burkholderia]ABO58162.1 pseudoazurin [Burkholderia vietnamiensis G4]AJY03708.1 pseudoazurin [Burkholderia vietnamiensis LMG 10929]AOJ98845.1 pseudoazurin [Burkholderia vietnamiensis]AVR12609.1 pseudoazurin [Burkholderia vietnamiensis]KVE17005.1 pseudoazurin [Burkholderia vietnamiensis]